MRKCSVEVHVLSPAPDCLVHYLWRVHSGSCGNATSWALARPINRKRANSLKEDHTPGKKADPTKKMQIRWRRSPGEPACFPARFKGRGHRCGTALALIC
jgi:hypothetical protein